MKKILFLILVINLSFSGFSQTDTAKYLFMGHPRDDNRDYEQVLKTVEKIDYSKFNLTLLGGDLTWNTSADRSTLEYCDNIFHLGSDSTHLSSGNHDLDNLTLLLEFTKKPRYYAFSRNNIVFLILDTEVSTPDFKGEQLELIQSVADTIENADYMVVVLHRIFWMVGVPELSYLMDSVAASTKNLTRTNFYDEVYPLFQKTKGKGIKVLCLAGDRTDVNIAYYPEDSITFLASGMRGTVPDDSNFVIILTHHIPSGNLSWEFSALNEIDTITSEPLQTYQKTNFVSAEINIYPNPSEGMFRISFNISYPEKTEVVVLNINGLKLIERTLQTGYDFIDFDLSDLPSGIYFIHLRNNSEIICSKLIRY